MKKMKLILVSAGLVIAALALNSCDDDGYSLDKVWYSIATINPLSDTNAYSLTLDDGTTLWPAATAIPWYKPSENQRALVMYTLLSDEFQGYDHAVKVHDIQNVLTKAIAEDLGAENDRKYGTDPVKILDMWIGDGYLNVKFGFNYGGGVKHFINLVKRDSVDAPYYFEFRHNAYNDSEHIGQKGLVAFDLSTLDTAGKDEISLTIHVKTFEGEKDYTITYNPSKQPAAPEKNLSDHFVEIR
jgi:hypothetical protein